MSHACFITFEGIEGSGKSTQIELLRRELVRQGFPVLTTREPGGTTLGEGLRQVLMAPESDIAPLAELLLMEAARAQHVTQVLRPALQRGEWVLCDRFADSSTAYQGGGRGLGWPLVEDLNQVACQGLHPHRTVLLDLPVAEGLGRARRRPSTSAANCRFEDEVLAFHRRVAEAYLELASRHPARIVVVPASGTPGEVHAHVLAALRELWS